VLDQLSDMLDRVQAEAFLESARRPESVSRLLAMIGYDAVALAAEAANIPDATPPAGESEAQQRARLTVFRPALQLFGPDYQSIIESELTAAQQTHLAEFIADPAADPAAALDSMQLFLDNAPQFVERARNHALQRYWTLYPHAMDAARTAGPRTIHTQKRMVTVNDYAERLEDHPLVMAAHGFSRWTGAWITIYVAVIMTNNILLDEPLTPAAVGGAEAFAILTDAIDDFSQERNLEPPEWTANPTPRTVLRPYLDAYRMAGREVFLQDADLVGISIAISVRVAANYFQSEVRRAVRNALGIGLGGFFAAGRLKFGQDLHASDLIETVMALDGVQSVCLNRFKRVGKRFPDQSDDGRIQLDGLEIAVCENDPLRPEHGSLRIVMHGGQRG